MPERCTRCDANRYLSGILFQNADLKRENDRLKATLDLVERIVRGLSRDVRKEFERGMKA
ncbi:MAG: hypothetical protein M0P69_17650 [Bacteroidales bacterium]|nr:hypothetical protein [Bacteroidales bacterium]